MRVTVEDRDDRVLLDNLPVRLEVLLRPIVFGRIEMQMVREHDGSSAVVHACRQFTTQELEAAPSRVVVPFAALLAFADKHSEIDEVDRPPTPRVMKAVFGDSVNVPARAIARDDLLHYERIPLRSVVIAVERNTKVMEPVTRDPNEV